MKWIDLLRDNKIITLPGGYWSNGFLAIKGDPPKEVLALKSCWGIDKRDRTIESLFPADHLKLPILEIIDGPIFTDIDANIIKTTILKVVGGGLEVAIQTDYYNFLKYFIKEPFILLAHDRETAIICKNLKGEILAVIMPLKLC